MLICGQLIRCSVPHLSCRFYESNEWKVLENFHSNGPSKFLLKNSATFKLTIIPFTKQSSFIGAKTVCRELKVLRTFKNLCYIDNFGAKVKFQRTYQIYLPVPSLLRILSADSLHRNLLTHSKSCTYFLTHGRLREMPFHSTVLIGQSA